MAASPHGAGRSIPPHGLEVLEPGAGGEGDAFRGRQLSLAEPPVLAISFGTWPLKALADAHGRPDFAELTLKETALDSPEFRRDQLTNRAH